MGDSHRWIRLALRTMLFAVPVLALVVLAYGSVNFVRAQLLDIPEAPRVKLLVPASEEPLDLRPETLQTRVLGLYLRLQGSALEKPAGASDVKRVFTVLPGETALSVSDRLEQLGLVSDSDLFRNYMRYRGLDQRLAAGSFELAPSMPIPEIARTLLRARVTEVSVTVPEGMRAEEVADLVNTRAVLDGDGLLALVRGGSASAEALGDYPFVPKGLSSLEGYLFPDTYRLPAQATPADLLRRMLDNFEARVDQSIQNSIQAGGRGLQQVLTVASIVEREAVRNEERATIASVYWNRVSGACSAQTGSALLEADPTVQYAAGRSGEWWWKPPSIESYRTVDSPYNTYLYPGLPPGPIASPGLASIRAAAEPATTRYCFFVATGDGGHVFAEKLAEHQQNVQKYQK